MKITDVIATPVSIPFQQAWANDRRYYVKAPIQTNVIVQIVSDEGPVGYGEAAHAPGVLGETAQGTLGGIELFTPLLIGQDPRQITRLNARLDRVSPVGNIAAKAAIDIALHDLTGKVLGVPVYQLLGGRVHDKLLTHISPAVNDNLEQHVLDLKSKGFRVFKQKMSGNTEYDQWLIRTILAVSTDGVLISLDPNQGWSVNQTLQIARRIEQDPNFRDNVILEQPIWAADVHGMARIRNNTRLPVLADDGLRSLDDLMHVIELQAADIVSLKPSRVGGLQRTQQMIALAEAANLDYLVDEIIEMRVANTAVAHLALAARRPRYTGVCCHLLLERDVVTEGGVMVENGFALVSDEPGLGIRGLSLAAAETAMGASAAFAAGSVGRG